MMILFWLIFFFAIKIQIQFFSLSQFDKFQIKKKQTRTKHVYSNFWFEIPNDPEAINLRTASAQKISYPQKDYKNNGIELNCQKTKIWQKRPQQRANLSNLNSNPCKYKYNTI